MITIIVLLQTLATAGQTTRELEQQHIRIIEELGAERSAHEQAVAEIVGIQRDIRTIRTAQDSIKPALEEVVKEMRTLNQTLAIANAQQSSQIDVLGKVLALITNSLVPLIVAVFIGSKTPLGKRLLNGRKADP